MVSPFNPNRPFLLLNREQAAEFKEVAPAEVEPGVFIVSDLTLTRPDYAHHIPSLERLPRCKIDDSTRTVKRNSVRAADNIPRPQPARPSDGNPWSRTVLPARGDWSEAKLHQSVGRALSAWEDFEVAFSNLFVAILSPSFYSLPALRAFGSVITFNGRLDMIKAAAEAKFAFWDSPHRKSFEATIRQCERLSPRRNEIAHGSVAPYRIQPGKSPLGLALMPGEHARRHRELREGANLAALGDLARDDPPWVKDSDLTDKDRTLPGYAYTTLEIDHFQKLFKKLEKDVSGLADKLWVRFDQVQTAPPGPLHLRRVLRHKTPHQTYRK